MINLQAFGLLSIKAGETLYLKQHGVHLIPNPLQARMIADQIAATLISDNESTLTVLMDVRK